MWLRCWRRVLALLAQAFYGVQFWLCTPASESSELGQVACDRTAFRYESLFALVEDPASLQFPPPPPLDNRCSWLPFMLLTLAVLLLKYMPGGSVLTSSWPPGSCSSPTLCCWEIPVGAVDPTSRVLLDQLSQKSKTVQAFYGTTCSSLMPFGFHVQ